MQELGGQRGEGLIFGRIVAVQMISNDVNHTYTIIFITFLKVWDSPNNKMFKFKSLAPTADFIKLVKSWSFYTDMYGDIFFSPIYQ